MLLPLGASLMNIEILAVVLYTFVILGIGIWIGMIVARRTD